MNTSEDQVNPVGKDPSDNQTDENPSQISDARKHGKALAKAARDEARRIGQRVTMSMFVIETL